MCSVPQNDRLNLSFVKDGENLAEMVVKQQSVSLLIYGTPSVY